VSSLLLHDLFVRSSTPKSSPGGLGSRISKSPRRFWRVQKLRVHKGESKKKKWYKIQEKLIEEIRSLVYEVS
jgi:hypothetical protein